MSWSEKMKNALGANQVLLASAQKEDRALSEDEKTAFAKNQTAIEEARLMLDMQNSTNAVDAELKTVVAPSAPAMVGAKPAPTKVYKNFTEQLVDIKNAAVTGIVSEKLAAVQNAALGMNEGVGSEGGFAVQSDFAGMILESAVKDDGILNRVDSYQVSGNANSVDWVDIDESDISTNVFGGIQVYWAAEASAVAASKPSLKESTIKLEKLMGISYVTTELDADSSFVDSLLTRGFTTAINRTLTGAIVSGDGVGKPTGILNGGGLVTVAKESGQVNDTVVWENITKMFNVAIEPYSGGWAWIVHPDVHDQLDNMDRVVGTGGIPVYQPASMTGSVDTLRGLPVLTSDHCSALGDVGDIMLVDLSDYFLPFKGAIQEDTSMHVQFLTAENAFRFIYRVNGRPKTLNQLTIKNSSKKRGKYITLAAR